MKKKENNLAGLVLSSARVMGASVVLMGLHYVFERLVGALAHGFILVWLLPASYVLMNVAVGFMMLDEVLHLVEHAKGLVGKLRKVLRRKRRARRGQGRGP